MLGDDIPEGAEEVTQNEDEKDQAEHSEDIHDVDLLHDLVVVKARRLHPRVLLNRFVNATAVDFLEERLELLSVEQEQH